MCASVMFEASVISLQSFHDRNISSDNYKPNIKLGAIRLDQAK